MSWNCHVGKSSKVFHVAFHGKLSTEKETGAKVSVFKISTYAGGRWRQRAINKSIWLPEISPVWPPQRADDLKFASHSSISFYSFFSWREWKTFASHWIYTQKIYYPPIYHHIATMISLSVIYVWYFYTCANICESYSGLGERHGNKFNLILRFFAK